MGGLAAVLAMTAIVVGLIMSTDVYKRQVLEQAYEGVSLNGRFIQATYTVWKHLIRDPYIYDLVKEDSAMRIKDNAEIVIACLLYTSRCV